MVGEVLGEEVEVGLLLPGELVGKRLLVILRLVLLRLGRRRLWDSREYLEGTFA